MDLWRLLRAMAAPIARARTKKPNIIILTDSRFIWFSP